MLCAGVSSAFVPGYWIFTTMRFLLGLSVGGIMVTSFVIMMEFIGVEYREVASSLYQVPFNCGHMMLPAISYFLRDFSHFQMAISAPSAILLSYFILVPESPRWLIAVNRTDEAIIILERAAEM